MNSKSLANKFVMEARKARRALLIVIVALAAIAALGEPGPVRQHGVTDAPCAGAILQGCALVAELMPRGCWTGDLPVQTPFPIPRVPRPSKSVQGIFESAGGQ